MRERIFTKAEGMGVKRDRIPDKVLKEIFPKKLSRSQSLAEVYAQLNKMILSGKVKKGRRLIREKIAQDLNVSENALSIAFSKLKRDGLVVIKWGGRFVCCLTKFLDQFRKEDGMRKKVIFTLLVVWMTFLTIPALAEPGVSYGKVVGTEFNVIQVKNGHGRISWFWMGHRTHFGSRVPFFGDRVRVEYVKDKLGRNAVTRVTILGR